MGRNRLNYFTICSNFRKIKQGGYPPRPVDVKISAEYHC